MKYCISCGAELNDNARYCPKCGSSQSDNRDVGSSGAIWGILGFLFPFVGLILYFAMRNDDPRSARAAGKGTLIGAIFYAAIIIGLQVLVFMLTRIRL